MTPARHITGGLLVLATGILAAGCASLVVDTAGAPENALAADGNVNRWVVLGPFPNGESRDPTAGDGAYRQGYHRDFLQTLGGEAAASLAPNTHVPYRDEQDVLKMATAFPFTAQAGRVDFEKAFGPVSHRVAYAFTYLDAPAAGPARLLFGSADGAKIWLNGQLVHELWVEDREVSRGEDDIEVSLRAGRNALLVKVENGWGPWAFVLEALDNAGYEARMEKRRELYVLRDFQDARLEPTGRWKYMFPPGAFPRIAWRDPYRVEHLVGRFRPRVRWFDGDLNEVRAPRKPGRYLVYLEGRTPNGMPVRRAHTFYCRPSEWRPWEDDIMARLDRLPNSPIDAQAWQERRDIIGRAVGKRFIWFLETQEEGAILASYLHEMKPGATALSPTDTPAIHHDDAHLALKRRIIGAELKYPRLHKPSKTVLSAPPLRPGSATAAGVHPQSAATMRQVCGLWAASAGRPFGALVARHGTIVLHETFSPGGDRPAPADMSFPVGSLAETMTGLMFAQLLDQHHLRIDDPVGKHLPDFPVRGGQAVTLRHCFTHTTGLSGYYEWGGMHNPWLDNVILNGLSYLRPGHRFEQSGMGYDLAGKVMEVAAGKSIFRLMHENLFEPLGLRNIRMDDLGFATECTVEDLGRLGQLLLNRGTYGGREFFSRETFRALLPQRLGRSSRDEDIEWGIGLSWQRVKRHAGQGSRAAAGYVLSRNTIGQADASGSRLMVDLDNELVIALAMAERGAKYDRFLVRFLDAVATGLTTPVAAPRKETAPKKPRELKRRVDSSFEEEQKHIPVNRQETAPE